MKAQRKIVYFLDFPHSVGGSNKVLLTQAYIMRRRGYQVTIVIPNDENGIHAPEYDRICKKFELDIVTSKFDCAVCMEDIDILSALEHYSVILELLEKEKPDLIHSAQLNLAVEMAARTLHIPHLMNIYQVDQESFQVDWLALYPRYHSADSILFSERWSHGLHIPSRCVRVAYENKEEISLKCDSKAGFIQIISIGILCERKNQLEIIRFVHKCKDNGIKVLLTLLGEESLSYGLLCKKYVKENGLEENVIFTGFVSNIENYLRKADILIIASKIESYPGVIVEAMANNVPILSTPVGGVPELLIDGYNGLVIEGYCAESIYKTFERYLLYKKENKIMNFTMRAYETYVRYHSYEVVEKQLEEYYSWIWDEYGNYNEGFQIEAVKDIFFDFQQKFMDGDVDTYTKRHVWYLYHVAEKIKRCNPGSIAIWGAGYYGRIALEWIKCLNCMDKFRGFIDTHKEGNYLNYPILKGTEAAVRSCDFIFVGIGAINYRLEVMKMIEQYGKKRNIDYFMLCNG